MSHLRLALSNFLFRNAWRFFFWFFFLIAGRDAGDLSGLRLLILLIRFFALYAILLWLLFSYCYHHHHHHYFITIIILISGNLQKTVVPGFSWALEYVYKRTSFPIQFPPPPKNFLLPLRSPIRHFRSNICKITNGRS